MKQILSLHCIWIRIFDLFFRKSRKIEELENTLKNATYENEKLNLKLIKLEECLKKSKLKIDVLDKEIIINEIKIRKYNFVSDALNAKRVENKYLIEFASLIENDYKKEFCNIESGTNDAENLRKLDQVLKEMQLITNCPLLYGKTIGAIGGGFSSGKSSFINSFITESKVKLAEGPTPVTVIPSYVICDQDTKINGISFRGGHFSISHEVYDEISHEFVKSFTFDLKELIKYTTVHVPMVNQYFDHLCLIDTPGYDSGNSKQDYETAQKIIKDADFLIWSIAIDKNGTIPNSDIDFIYKLDLDKNKPIYIVANKAQLITPNNRERKLDEFETILNDYDILYDGITAYNSYKKELLSSRKCDIYEFLSRHNKPSKKYNELRKIVNDVFKQYKVNIINEYEEKKVHREKVKLLLYNSLATGKISIDDESSILEDGLNELLHYFSRKEVYDERIIRVDKLEEKFIKCLNGFCDDIGIDRKENSNMKVSEKRKAKK
jgi:hypothetical protein